MTKVEDTDGNDDRIHLRDLDVSERRRVTPAEREVLGLLGLATDGPWVRLSLAWWSRVDAVAARLEPFPTEETA